MKNDLYQALEEVFQDGPFWSWWAANFPNSFQIEFNRALLYDRNCNLFEAPTGQIALSIEQPTSITFLDFVDDINENWVEDMHSDRIGGFVLSDESFFINNDDQIRDLLESASKIKTIFGNKPNDSFIRDSTFKATFKAGEVGLIVFGEQLRVFDKMGELTMTDIKSMNKKWWDYWKKYWEMKKSDTPLPKDELCEVIFPTV